MELPSLAIENKRKSRFYCRLLTRSENARVKTYKYLLIHNLLKSKRIIFQSDGGSMIFKLNLRITTVIKRLCSLRKIDYLIQREKIMNISSSPSITFMLQYTGK